MSAMIAETSFITIETKEHQHIQMLKSEAIDRLYSVVYDLPKYRLYLQDLIVNFTIDAMLRLINTIYRDKEFKSSRYYRRYSEYFDEIEDLTHKYI